MIYKDRPGSDPGASGSLGLLLVNLGTPEAPSTSAVRRYLAEFLWDPRVVEMPRALWWLILHGIVLRIRPRRSARAYRSIWTEAGSPLLVISQKQRSALRERLPEFAGVELGMRYGAPSIAEALGRLQRAHIDRLLVLPLYPQYSAATTASAFDRVTWELSRWRWIPEFRFIDQYHDFPPYIAALADRIQRYWTVHGRAERLVFSFHGLPKKAVERGDPYLHQCHRTGRLVAESLGLASEDWAVSFQSRVGNQEWIQPYTDRLLDAWGRDGVRSVHVCCPGFSADCLETLEEIALENRRIFIEAGGREYGYIPALNEESSHLDALAALIRRHTSGW